MTVPNQLACGGIDSCLLCRRLWRRKHDDQRPRCVLCEHHHWPWDPHIESAAQKAATRRKARA